MLVLIARTVQALALGPHRALDRAVGFRKFTFFLHGHTREAVIGRELTEDHENGVFPASPAPPGLSRRARIALWVFGEHGRGSSSGWGNTPSKARALFEWLCHVISHGRRSSEKVKCEPAYRLA